MTGEKVDLFRQLKGEYAAKPEPRLVTTSSATYLAIEGSGPPGGETFQDRIGALYGAAYTVKMTRKFEGRQDYVVCKLEAQYWDAEGDDLRWRFLIRTPDFVTQAELDAAVEKLLEKGKSPSVREVRLVPLDEVTCVQMLHVGPYDRERETLDVMERFVAEQGLERNGPHHEVYLSDPRRVAPEKLRTILRLPVR
jgi:hypothetical protein